MIIKFVIDIKEKKLNAQKNNFKIKNMYSYYILLYIMLDPQRMSIYNIILSVFAGIFLIFVLVYFLGRNRIVVLNNIT